MQKWTRILCPLRRNPLSFLWVVSVARGSKNSAKPQSCITPLVIAIWQYGGFSTTENIFRNSPMSLKERKQRVVSQRGTQVAQRWNALKYFFQSFGTDDWMFHGRWNIVGCYGTCGTYEGKKAKGGQSTWNTGGTEVERFKMLVPIIRYRRLNVPWEVEHIRT